MCEARNFTACVDEIYGVRREIFSVGLEGGFRATRCRSKICSVKYGAEFCGAAHGDKIYGGMADDKIFGTTLAGAVNSEFQNSCANLRPRNTYADLKFKGSANSKPEGDLNSKFKNSPSFRFLCGGNTKLIKSNGSADALNPSGANKILASVWTGRILSSAISAVDLVFNAAAKNFISSAETGILASILVNEILNLSAAGEISKPNATGKILNLSAVPLADFGPKGAGGC